MNIAKFNALVWRSYRLRRFRYIHTTFEFVIPIFAAFIIAYYPITKQSKEIIYPSVPRNHFVSAVRKIELYYAPSKLVIKNFMNQIQNNFVAVRGLSSEAELEIALKNNPRHFGIYFENIVSNESLPNKLRYKLRNSNSWRTEDMLNSQKEKELRTRKSWRFAIKLFASIQFILNENFVKNKTNIKVFPKVNFEWFPIISHVTPSLEILNNIKLFVMLITLTTSMRLILDIIEEKNSGMKELIKLTGLNEWTIWFGWFAHAFIISFISFSVAAILIASSLNGAGFARFFIFWIFLTLYCAASISLSFMFSSIFQSEVAFAGFGFFCCIQYLGIWVLHNALSDSLLKWSAIIPNVAFILGFDEMSYFETQENGLAWSSVTFSGHNSNSVSLLFCFSMLLFDTFLYLFLAYYITSINPGKFGTPESPLFIFKSLFSSFYKDHTNSLRNELKLEKEEHEHDEVESEYIEASPPGVEAIIRMKDLHKNFGSVHAVRGVNLNIYPNEFAALLGHNGAGKTATISMLTGQTPSSAGSIYYENKNILEDMTSFKKIVGVCPQENRTMAYLTVMEHLIFFGKLRELSFEAVIAEADGYLSMMEMLEKKETFVKNLSGGMSRKLSVCIALMGKAKILILDEPTAGLDVRSKRKFWYLLMNLRKERTIIFTTHDMKEADVLGDRITIMNHGSIICHGTPMFLKKVYDAGYELTIIKSNVESEDVDEVIKSILPNAIREDKIPKKVVYKLPLHEIEKFPILFKNLESNMERLGIESLEVSASTMEHIFLKVNESFVKEQNVSSFTTDTSFVFKSHRITHVEGVALYAQQITALMKKKYWCISRDLMFVLINIFAPLLNIILFLFLFQIFKIEAEPPLNLLMNAYPGSTVVLKNNITDLNFEKHLSEYVAEKGGLLISIKNGSIEAELLKLAEDISKYDNNYISAFELNSNTTKILSNPLLTHSLPITVTTYTNVVLRNLTKSKLYEIVTINHPVQNLQESCESLEMSMRFYIFWYIFLAVITIIFPISIVAFVHRERIDGFQHIQFMSNVSPLIYWLGNFLFDTTFFLCITLIRVGVCKIVDHSDFLSFDTNLGVFILLTIAFGTSDILFSYTVDFLDSTKESNNKLTQLKISGTFFVFVFYFIKFFVDSVFLHIVESIILVIPPLNFLLLFIKFMVIFNSNARCSFCSEALRPICEDELKKKSYFEFASEENKDGLLLGMLFFMVDIVLYSTILYCINMGYIQYWLNSLKNLKWNTTDPTNEDKGDNDVQEEFKKVQKYKQDESKMNKIVLLVDGLRKIYFRWFKPFVAVSSANFIVEPGECFGLLGTNGAGKTTTFKMLVAKIYPTLGDASIKNIKLSAQKWQYLSMAGYCPEINCFLDELTGKEMLTTIANFRGVPKNEIEAVVHEWINILGLHEYQNKRCATYSGGNKRKLCATMALLGDPSVVFLDEPTAGIDLYSRRNLYKVMTQKKRIGQAVVFASDSMDECEVICDRLTIMNSGVMKCIGTAQHLKKLYAQGFSLLIKINNNIQNFDNEVAELKSDMLKAFTEAHCILENEYMGILHYRITDTSLLWSVFFENMEGIKSLHQKLVAEYLLAETTLEEIFSSFEKDYSNKNQDLSLPEM